MDKLIQQYVEKFNENFPLFCVSDLDDEELEALIRDCLDKGTPYKPPDLDEKAVY